MTLRDVTGQERAVTALTAALASHNVAHAWLFEGPEGVGKELAALGLAQALTCPEAPWEGCGTCPSCARVARRNHPDVTWLLPQDEQVRRGYAGRSDFAATPSRDIRVEQVRGLQERLAFHALEAPHKVALIVTAHAMNASAQNALLKTLEEPPAGTVLVLVSSQAERLLPTIRSRCARVAFRPLSEAFLAARVKAERACDDATAAVVAALAGGSLSRALAFDPASLARRRDVIERFEAVGDDARAWLALAEALGEERDAAEAALDVLQVWLRDVGVAQAGGEGLVNADLAELARAAAARLSPAGLQRRLRLLEEARVAIARRNGMVRLQLERMLVEMFA